VDDINYKNLCRKNMTEIKVENATKDLFGLIDGHAVLLAHGAQTRMPELVYCMMSSLAETTGVPMSMIFFTEQDRESCNEFGCNHISDMDNVFAPPHGDLQKYSLGGVTCTDMTELLMKIESKMQARQLLFLEDLAFLRWRHNKIPFMRFLELLASRVRDKKGTMICTVALNMFDTETEKLLYTIFDTVLYLTEDAIKFGPRKSKDDIKYTLEDGRLLLKSVVSTDLKKVKEIFSLSMEDRKELDKIVHEHIEEYKRS
jgi:hypothetical protein